MERTEESKDVEKEIIEIGGQQKKADLERKSPVLELLEGFGIVSASEVED